MGGAWAFMGSLLQLLLLLLGDAGCVAACCERVLIHGWTRRDLGLGDCIDTSLFFFFFR